MSEFLQCQDRLMRSACGSSLADFTLAVSIENHIRLATDAELQQQHCPTDSIMHDYSPSNIGAYQRHLMHVPRPRTVCTLMFRFLKGSARTVPISHRDKLTVRSVKDLAVAVSPYGWLTTHYGWLAD